MDPTNNPSTGAGDVHRWTSPSAAHTGGTVRAEASAVAGHDAGQLAGAVASTAACSGRHHMEWASYAGQPGYAGGPQSTASVWRCIHCPTEALIDTTHEDDSAAMVCEHEPCASDRLDFVAPA